MVRTRQFACHRNVEPDEVQDLIGEPDAGPPAQLRRTVLDTFDARLAARGLVLISDDDGRSRRLYLRRRNGCQLAVAETGRGQPLHGRALPDPRLRRKLAPVIEARALLPQVSWDVETRHVECRDNDDKSLGTIHIERQQFGAGESATTVCAIPRRGYQDEFADRLAAWHGTSLLEPLEFDAAATIAETLRGETPAYQARPAVELTPELSPSAALAALLDACRDIMENNEQGVRDDTDIEFLHDFRVTLRRARSLLRSFRGVVADDGGLGAELAWLGSVTGPVRDLDVWLDEVETEPPALLEFLHAERSAARRHLLAALASRRYVRLRAQWRDYVAALDASTASGSRAPLATVTSKLIWKQYRKVRRVVREHGERIAPAELHDLRKDVKRLRYLIEACAPLYPARDIERLQGDLKALQTSAGAVCDHFARTALVESWLQRELPAPQREVLLAELARHTLPAELRLTRGPFRKLGAGLRRCIKPGHVARYRKLFGRGTK